MNVEGTPLFFSAPRAVRVGNTAQKGRLKMKDIYGGKSYEMFGTVVNLSRDLFGYYAFNLKPLLCADAEVTDGNTRKLASILVCSKLVRSIRGMEREDELFVANRNWRFKVKDDSQKIEENQVVRILVAKETLDNLYGEQMRDDVEVSAECIVFDRNDMV